MKCSPLQKFVFSTSTSLTMVSSTETTQYPPVIGVMNITSLSPTSSSTGKVFNLKSAYSRSYCFILSTVHKFISRNSKSLYRWSPSWQATPSPPSNTTWIKLTPFAFTGSDAIQHSQHFPPSFSAPETVPLPIPTVTARPLSEQHFRTTPFTWSAPSSSLRGSFHEELQHYEELWRQNRAREVAHRAQEEEAFRRVLGRMRAISMEPALMKQNVQAGGEIDTDFAFENHRHNQSIELSHQAEVRGREFAQSWPQVRSKVVDLGSEPLTGPEGVRMEVRKLPKPPRETSSTDFDRPSETYSVLGYDSPVTDEPRESHKQKA